MAFVKKSFADIYTHLEQDARQRTPQLSDFQEGSVVRTLFESFAVELTTLYEQLDLVYQAGFIDTAEEANLDRVVAVLGIKRNEPDFAAGRVLFTRDPGSNEALTIPIGTLVTTVEDESLQPAKKAYITIEEGHLPVGQNEVEVKVQAEVRGRQMIADAETVVVMPRPVPGVKHVNNARSIRFLGRDRETDEELRQRAKQVLLASGRASSTSIETALLSMPGVRAVCIKEDRTRPGMIQIFIDGLTEQNYASLQQRVDQVRAAGIYVMLEPAHLINLTLTIRISVDRRVKGEERSALEQRVTDAVESFIQRIPMGQPLLFSQLTAEILSSKGVVDLDDFRLRAEQLTDPANPQITQYGISARRIEASIYERFVPVSVRVASETKPLAVDVQVRVAFPSQPLQSWLAAHHQDRLKECSTEPALLSYSGLLAVANGDPAASESTPIIAELQRFYSNLQTVASTIDWQIGLNELTQAALVEIVRSYFATVQEENPSGGGQISSRKILAHLNQLGAAGKLDKAWSDYAQAILQTRLQRFNQIAMETFPDQAVADSLNATIVANYQSALQAAQNTQQAALAAAEQQFRSQSELIDPLTDQTSGDTAERLQIIQKELQDQQEAATQAYIASEAESTMLRNRAHRAVQAQVAALRLQVQSSLDALASEEALLQLLNASDLPYPYDFTVGLRSLLFNGALLSAVELIEASFVERPQPGLIFVYSDRVELSGRMQMRLPAKTSPEAISNATQSLRQTIERYLETLQPQEGIDLEALKEIVNAQGQTTFAATTLALVKVGGGVTGEERSPLPDRNKGKKISVGFGEKVFLAAAPAFKIEVEQ